MVSNKGKLLAAALSVSFCLGALAAMPTAQAKADSGSHPAISEEHINKKPYQVVRMKVQARPEQVWQVLTNYSTASQIFPTLKKCHVVADNGNTKRVHYQIHPTGSLSRFQYDLEVRETPHKHIEWRRISGDFKEVDGYWRLEPVDGGHATMVTYASHVNGGLFLPQTLIKRQVKIDIPHVMSALKSHSETATQIATRSNNHQQRVHSN